ncbi:hypothetical protein Dimus_006768 [Dionaea muscipula]
MSMEINATSCVPPGFRFHPTEEELVGYYLQRKINSLRIDLDIIVDIDLYNMEPWDIQDRCNLGYDEQREWYFFSHKDKKYPTGSRTNRATAAGFWKATGRDKAVLSCKTSNIIGMRKTLVFYKGRAPNGTKTDWIMHEYRLLQTAISQHQQEEAGWVVCRAFKKPCPTHKQALGLDQANWNYMYMTSSGFYARDRINGNSSSPPSSVADHDDHLASPSPMLDYCSQGSTSFQYFQYSPSCCARFHLDDSMHMILSNSNNNNMIHDHHHPHPIDHNYNHQLIDHHLIPRLDQDQLITNSTSQLPTKAKAKAKAEAAATSGIFDHGLYSKHDHYDNNINIIDDQEGNNNWDFIYRHAL